MADSVEGIVIEIESQSGAAISDLEALGSALESLKTKLSNNRAFKTFSKNYVEMVNTFNSASMDYSKLESFRYLSQIMSYFTSKSTAPLKSFAKNYVEAVNAINNGATFDRGKLESLRYFSYVLNGMRGVTISPTIAKQIDNIGFVIQNINTGSLANISELVEALMQLTKLKDVNISKSFVDNLTKLVELSQKMQGYDFAKLNEFTSALANMGSLAGVNSSAVKGLITSIKNLGDETKKASSKGKTFDTVLANIRTKTVAILMVTRRLAQYTMKAMTVYGNYVEALNLYKMALGDAAKAEYEFAEQAQNILGIDLTQWMQAQGVFSALASGFGVASDKAALMSRNLTQLAYDISSFYNISVEDAIQKVQSGFAGQIRPVRNLGYDLSQAKLEAIALANGIDKEVKSMTQAEKAQLRYVALMTQLTQVQGDLARTLDSPTNQMRLLNAQLDQMTRSIGMVLLPILNKVVPYLNAIFRVIKMIAEEIAAMFGYTLPRIADGDWTSTVTMGAEDLEEDLEDATGAAEKLKNTLASFDQINLITSKSGGSGGGGSASVGGSDLGIDLPSYDFLGDATVNKAQELADGMMKSLRPFVDWLKDTIKWIVDNIDTVSQVLTTLATISIGKTLVNSILDVLGLTEKLHNYVSGLAMIAFGIQFSYLGGEDLAKGDLLKGILKSTIGAAATALGFSFMFGPAGIVIGLALSLTFTLYGYFDEKSKQKAKQLEEDFFGAFKDYKTDIEEFERSWEHFLEQFYQPEATEKSSVADNLRENVEGIGKAMQELQQQYATGSITGVSYSANLIVMYAEMEEAVKKHLEAVGDAINEYLDGPFGDYLRRHNIIVEDVKDNIEQTTNDVINQIEKNRLALQELDHDLQTGKISWDEYKEKSDELIKPLQNLYEITGMNTEATSGFLEKFSNLAIDFSDWDQVYATLDEVQKGYKEAGKSIDKTVDEIKEKFTLLRDASETEEMRAYYQNLINMTDDFGEEQHQILTNAYRDVLESFENTGMVNWVSVFDNDGLKDAVRLTQVEMAKFDLELEKVYGDANIKRRETNWKQLMQFSEYIEQWELDNGKRRTETLQEYGDEYALFAENYVLQLYKQKEATKGLSEEEQEKYRILRNLLGGTDEEIKKNTDKLKEYADYISKYTSSVEGDTVNVERKVKVHFDSMGNIIAVTSDDMVDDMSYAIGAIGTMIGNDAWTVKPMSANLDDLISIVDGEKGAFTNSFWGLMNSATYVLGDPTGMMQRSLFSALDIPELKLVGLGYDLGASIAEGIEESTPEISAAAHHWATEIAREWNIFGTEADKYFEAIFENGMAALNLLGVGNNVTSSVFNVKKARIRGYASGGFPDTADFFFANENGIPEYVGTMGGRTAVANNMEITKGVADGVYKAIKDTGLIGDVRKIASKDGKVVFAPSEEAGKVMSQSVGMYNGTGGRY